jgi:hypothetical protein
MHLGQGNAPPLPETPGHSTETRAGEGGAGRWGRGRSAPVPSPGSKRTRVWGPAGFEAPGATSWLPRAVAQDVTFEEPCVHVSGGEVALRQVTDRGCVDQREIAVYSRPRCLRFALDQPGAVSARRYQRWASSRSPRRSSRTPRLFTASVWPPASWHRSPSTPLPPRPSPTGPRARSPRCPPRCVLRRSPTRPRSPPTGPRSSGTLA